MKSSLANLYIFFFVLFADLILKSFALELFVKTLVGGNCIFHSFIVYLVNVVLFWSAIVVAIVEFIVAFAGVYLGQVYAPYSAVVFGPANLAGEVATYHFEAEYLRLPFYKVYAFHFSLMVYH